MSTHFAFVTLLTSDSYLPGALAISGALKDVHQLEPQSQLKYDTVCIVTPETLDITTIKLLRRAYDVVIGVEVIDQQDSSGLSLLGRPDLDTVLTKIHVFRLTQYSKIIFLDADVLPIRSLLHLFHLDHEFSAVPDVGWPDIFNSGVMVLTPGEEKFKQLQELLKVKGTWDGGDQGLLNEWRGSDWNRLSFTYNTTPTAAYTYAPAYERFGSQISVVHFIGPNKPWHSIPYRAPGSSATQALSPQMQQPPVSEPANKQPQQAYSYGSLVDRWYNIYDRHYRSKPITPDSIPVSKRVSVWDDETNASASAMVQSPGASGGSPLGLDVLRRLALQGMGALGFRTGDRSQGDGEYKSMPLDGRIDLMRPRPAKQNQPEEQSHDQSAPEPADSDSDPDDVTPNPTTPVQQMSSLPSGSPARWTTLPTPNCDEVPPAPYTRLLSLPSTPFSEGSPSYKPFMRGNQAKSPLSLQERRMERSRPTSPPLLSWDAAVEPPPKSLSTPSAIPRDTYFPNIWDESPSKHRDRATSSSSGKSSETDATSTEVIPDQANPSPQTLFSPPPVPDIPRMLLQLGHYRNVTGPPVQGGTAPPTPDRSKVKRVFPWEERPRASPARVFPEEEPPLPGSIFMQSPPRSAVPPSTPPRRLNRDFGAQLPLPSPLAGFPSFPGGNMWDGVPGIHKFASKLARPAGPTPLASAFGDTPTMKPWEEKSATSSDDADVEDEADSSSNDEDDDKQTATKGRSRSSSVSTARRKKKYRSFGMQTDVKEMCSQSVQVSAEQDATAKPSSRSRAESVSMKKQWQPSSSLRLPPVMDVAAGAEPGLLSPATPQALTLPPSVSVPVESTVGSAMNGSLETLSPLKMPERHGEAKLGVKGFEASRPRSVSPNEGHSPSTPSTPSRVSRVWDPSRGVELFKRGSEEVLARFLKISSPQEPTSRIR
nr:putative glycogenin [Rhizopogon roseolus]